MRAFILLDVRTGKCPEVIGKLRKIEGVTSANACWGRPDVFVVVDVPNQSVLSDTVLNKIQTIDGIESTDTHIVID
ncbi:MAG: AsnC family transcriptional regulator [Acidobacteria bacterium]|nr:MAG: AsnC family transcriptional regulator [Acidobacteriota bacterium]